MILEQMAITQTSNEISTLTRLTTIYTTMKANIKSQSFGDTAIAQQKAQRLASFLTMLKRASKKGGISKLSTNAFAGFFEGAEQVAVKTLLMQLNTASRHHDIDGNIRTIFNSNYFNQISQDSTTLGMYLERGLSQVIKSFEALTTNKRYTKTDQHMVGTAHTQINSLLSLADDAAKQEVRDIYTYTRQQLYQYKNTPITTELSYVPSVQGKIDTTGLTAQINIAFDDTKLSHLALEMLDILKDATFTDKNYISLDVLKFGQTNPARIYAIVNGGAAGYYQMLNCFRYHSHGVKAQTLFYRIRALYELTGYGASYINMKQLNGQIAKYLVWNNPLTDTVQVISTAAIMENLIDKLEAPQQIDDALFAPITLSQSMLNQI